MRVDETRADLAAVRDIVADITSLAEKLAPASSDANTVVASQSPLPILSSSPTAGGLGMSTANMMILSQAVENLPDKLIRLQLLSQKLVALKTDIEARGAKYSAVFMQCTTATNVYHMFGQECQSTLRDFDFLDAEFESYKQSAPANVFPVLKTSSVAWNRFVASYDEMVIEIARRRREMARKQQIIDAYQKELDALYNGSYDTSNLLQSNFRS